MTTDLSWLPLSLRKNIDLPHIVFEPDANQLYGGYYQNNTLTIVESDIEVHNVAATIAHEFQHHLQKLYGSSGPGRLWSEYEEYPYNKSIRHYFRSQPWEMEALLFQQKVAPTAVGKFWLRGIVLPYKLDENLEM